MRVKEFCTGKVEEPTAAEGYLCVYQGKTTVEPNGSKVEYLVDGMRGPGSTPTPDDGEGEAGTSGAVLLIKFVDLEAGEKATHEMLGSWAVTAE